MACLNRRGVDLGHVVCDGVRECTGPQAADGTTHARTSRDGWHAFERICAVDLQLTPIEPPVFHQAALLALDASTGLRAADALHLATALDCKAKSIATLDNGLAANSKKKKIKPVEF
jgi:uncharacterized protein